MRHLYRPTPSRLLALTLYTGLAVVCAVRSHATVLLVPEDHTVEDALLLAQPGDEINVAAGTLDGGEVALVDGIRFVSREPLANRVELMTLEGLSSGVEVVGFVIGYLQPLEGANQDRLQGAHIAHSIVRFQDCLFQGIVPCGMSFSLSCLLDSTPRIPVRYTLDSAIEFEGCTFRGNFLGGNLHGEATSVQCVGPMGEGDPTGSLSFRECVFDKQPSPIYATVPLEVSGCEFRNGSDNILTATAGLNMEGCLVADWTLTDNIDCSVHYCIGYMKGLDAGGPVEIHGNTFVDTDYYWDSECVIHRHRFNDCLRFSDETRG